MRLTSGNERAEGDLRLGTKPPACARGTYVVARTRSIRVAARARLLKLGRVRPLARNATPKARARRAGTRDHQKIERAKSMSERVSFVEQEYGMERACSSTRLRGSFATPESRRGDIVSHVFGRKRAAEHEKA